MKPFLHALLIVCTAIFFTSCVKTVTAPAPVNDPLSGSWIISDASENAGNGWYSFDAGMNGTFTFYNNGTAQYDDGYTLMQGNWYRYIQSGGYYDENGNYYTDSHEALQVQVSNNNGASLDLYFDDIVYAGNNQLVATYYDGKNIQRYVFNRY